MSKAFAGRLRELRLERNMTQEDLSGLTGLSQSTITMYEQGQRTPRMSILSKLADFFDVSTDYLLGNSPIKKIEKVDKIPENTTPINKLAEEIFKDNPKVLNLLSNGIYAGKKSAFDKKLEEIPDEKKLFLEQSILYVLKSMGYDVDSTAKKP